jgi:hypothetical protein
MDLIKLAEEEIAEGWARVKTEAADIYYALQPIVAAPLKAFTSTVISQLWGAVAAFTAKLEQGLLAGGSGFLTNLETAFLNTLEHLWPNLLAAAQTLGSTILQSLLGIFVAKSAQAA